MLLPDKPHLTLQQFEGLPDFGDDQEGSSSSGFGGAPDFFPGDLPHDFDPINSETIGGSSDGFPRDSHEGYDPFDPETFDDFGESDGLDFDYEAHMEQLEEMQRQIHNHTIERRKQKQDKRRQERQQPNFAANRWNKVQDAISKTNSHRVPNGGKLVCA